MKTIIQKKIKSFFIPAGIVIIILFISSCQKNASDQIIEKQDPLLQKVSDWMSSQKVGKTESGIKKIDVLVKAMNFSGLRKEQ